MSVPILFLLGLALFRVALVRFFSVPLAALAFARCVLGVYLRALFLLPLRLLWRAVQGWMLAPLAQLVRGLWLGALAWRTRRMCKAQLALAKRGLLLSKPKGKIKRCRKKEKRVGEHHP